MHLPDRIWGHLFRSDLMFQDGWGDESELERLLGASWEASPITPRYGAPRRVLGGFRHDGRFESPVSWLSGLTRTGHVELLTPTRDRSAPTPLCLWLAASGEAGFARRRRFALPLLRRGIASLFLENPYYGRRQPTGQPGTKVRTVLDQFRMNRATLIEGVGLLHGLAGATPRRPLGVTGFSMGGYLAAMIGSRARLPLAIAPIATGRCPSSIYTELALSWSIDWPALGPGGRDRLRAMFQDATRDLPPPVDGSNVVLVAARSDGFVSPAEVLRLKDEWRIRELRWVGGGHVSTYVIRARAVRRAVKDAFEGLP